ncbi:hypothetical protein F5884DRAFT_260233 [Xylogone sp. PMI_703]|nr:hypothetical protein F5884DRAFT_260233 [Xylogone sp. PMI_703]
MWPLFQHTCTLKPPLSLIMIVLTMRRTKLATFGHDVHIIWNIAKNDGRTVIYESICPTVLKKEEGVGVKVKELSIVELLNEPNSTWKAVELRTYMDCSSVSTTV